MVGAAGGRRVVLALALCGAGYLGVSLLRLGRESADSASFPAGDNSPAGVPSSAEMEGASSGALARIASTVVVEAQPFASLSLKLVDASHAPALGVRAELEGKRRQESVELGTGDDVAFSVSAESDGQGVVSFPNVADAFLLSLVLGGEKGWVKQTLALAPLSVGEARDLGECVLLRGQAITGFVSGDEGVLVGGSLVKLTQPISPLDRRMNLGLAEPTTSSTLTTSVDEAGRFRFEGVAAGTYVLEASSPGFLSGRIEPLRVPEDASGDLELRLERGLVVHGRVLDENGIAVPDARVARIASTMALTAKSKQEIAEQDGLGVDAEGRFQLGGMRAEEGAFLIASAPQRVARVFALGVTSEEMICLLPSAHVLKAQILAHEGQPVAEAFARIEPLRVGPPSESWGGLVFDRERRADERGRLELDGLAEGLYRVVVSSAAGHLEREVSVPCSPLELVLAPAEALTVRVVDGRGQPESNLRVELALPMLGESAAPSAERTLRARTDGEGRALFHDLLRGFWNVRVLRGDATLVEETLEITSLPASVEYTAIDPGSLIVQVVNGSGQPLTGVCVRLARDGRAGNRRAASSGEDKVTDAFGRAAWIGVAAGDYLVSHETRDLGRMLGSGNRGRSKGSRVLVNVLPGTTLGATLTLAEPTLRVQVTRKGQPVSRAQVSYATTEDMPDLLTAMAIGLPVANPTDDAGWTTLVVSEPGEYLVTVRSSLMSPLTNRVCRVEKGSETLVVELEAGLVAGTCSVQGAAPVHRAQVHLIPASERGDSGTLLLNVSSPLPLPDDAPGRGIRVYLGETTTFTDALGGFRFDDVPAGVYHVEIGHPSFATWSSNPFPVAQNARVDMGELSLEPTCSLHGRIEYGALAEAAKDHPVIVRLLTRELDSVAMYTAEEDGRFEFTSLAPGLYQLAVECHDFSHSGEVFEILPEKANYQTVNVSN